MTPRATPHAEARRAQNDAIRTLYEDTPVPVREIARLAGVTERNIYALVRRLGCRPRVRLASGGGRRIVPFAAATDLPLDAASVRQAVQRCADAVQEANRVAAAARAARDQRAAMKQAGKDTESQARALHLLARALRDLAAITDKPEEGAVEPKPKRRRPYQWRPLGAPPAWAERRGK